jgi:hypothetical protein
MRIAIPSVGNTLLSTISLVGMGDIVTKDSFEWLAKDPKILRASNIIFRLMDDLVSSKVRSYKNNQPYMISHYILCKIG